MNLKKRMLIGVIIADCDNKFQEEIMRGIITQAFKSDCDIAVLAPIHNFFSKTPHKYNEKYIFDLILSDKFDGFLYNRNSFCDEGICDCIEELLVRSGKPTMLLDSKGHKNFEITEVDDCNAFEIITDHLIEVHGCKKIYCLTGPKKIYVSEERLSGYESSMKKHGLMIGRDYCHYGDFWINAAKELANRIISGELEKPDAIVCGNDMSAISLCNTLTAAGIKVPEDIAVTGYDASEEGAAAKPTITSYFRPNFQLGSESFRRLYRIITGKLCPKIPNESGELRLGRSCGCTEHHPVRSDIKRKKAINSSYEANLIYGDMLFDITNVDSTNAFADRLDNYTYLLYKMVHFRLCLTKKFFEAAKGRVQEKLSFKCGDEVGLVLAKSSIMREFASDEYFSSADIIPDFDAERNYPAAYYVSPLHYNDNFFGYCAVSYGKKPLAYTSLYPQWISYLNVALELVRAKAVMSRTIMNTNRALLYDKVTGLFSRSGVEQEFEKLVQSGKKNMTISFITIELVGIKNTYYRSGEEKCNQISAAFASMLKSCIRDREICGMWNNQTLCLISGERNRAAELYGSITEKIKEKQFEQDGSCNIDFSVGSCEQIMSDGINLSDAMYKSATNKVCSYNISENSANPQFEKLCALRNKIMKNPELSWKVSEIADSLYLSKSYLQKIYKSFFNKSIIEEMICFRIENARKLLIETELSVTEISRRCGYSSYNYFVRQFRMTEGISPSEFRELHSPEE